MTTHSQPTYSTSSINICQRLGSLQCTVIFLLVYAYTLCYVRVFSNTEAKISRATCVNTGARRKCSRGEQKPLISLIHFPLTLFALHFPPLTFLPRTHLHPLCLFSEVASRLSSSGVPSHDFSNLSQLLYCLHSAVVIFGHLNRSLCLLAYLPR